MDSQRSAISIHPMLRFIAFSGKYPLSVTSISIHPMLRFISTGKNGKNVHPVFQYIPCYGLSRMVRIIHLTEVHFNTSHVTVYLCAWSVTRFFVADFNTSHVTVYQISLDLRYTSIRNFNTSHVTVYRADMLTKIVAFFVFQYIPCYGLSWHRY